MKFAVVVMAVLGVACANPINPWGYGYGGRTTGSSIISVPSAVSVQSSIVNHGLSLPVVSKVVPVVRTVVPVIRPVVPVVKTVVPVVSPLAYGLGWNGLGYGLNGLGYGWGKGYGHH